MSDNFQELDKCPFCGKEGEFLAFLVENNQWMVMCHNCGAIGPNEINPDRAVEMWNLRRPYKGLKTDDELKTKYRALAMLVIVWASKFQHWTDLRKETQALAVEARRLANTPEDEW